MEPIYIVQVLIIWIWILLCLKIPLIFKVLFTIYWCIIIKKEQDKIYGDDPETPEPLIKYGTNFAI